MRNSFSRVAIEGDLIQTVEDPPAERGVPSRSTGLTAMSNVSCDVALAHQRGDGRIAGVAAIPVGFAVDFYRLEQGRQASRREQPSVVISELRKLCPRPVRTLVAVMNSLIGRASETVELIYSRR